LARKRCDHQAVPPSAPRQPRKDAVANRERLLDAATELIRREGERVPIADIALRAGVGVGTLYRHFATREELLGALALRSFDLAVTNARAAADHPGRALDGIRAFLTATLRDRERFVLPLVAPPAGFEAPIRERQAEVRAVLQGLLDRGHAAGELAPGLAPVDLIFNAVLLSRPFAAVEDWDAMAGRQIELLLRGFRAP
jgi:AcrR family transcriptional regulator